MGAYKKIRIQDIDTGRLEQGPVFEKFFKSTKPHDPPRRNKTVYLGEDLTGLKRNEDGKRSFKKPQTCYRTYLGDFQISMLNRLLERFGYKNKSGGNQMAQDVSLELLQNFVSTDMKVYGLSYNGTPDNAGKNGGLGSIVGFFFNLNREGEVYRPGGFVDFGVHIHGHQTKVLKGAIVTLSVLEDSVVENGRVYSCRLEGSIVKEGSFLSHVTAESTRVYGSRLSRVIVGNPKNGMTKPSGKTLIRGSELIGSAKSNLMIVPQGRNELEFNNRRFTLEWFQRKVGKNVRGNMNVRAVEKHIHENLREINFNEIIEFYAIEPIADLKAGKWLKSEKMKLPWIGTHD